MGSPITNQSIFINQRSFFWHGCMLCGCQVPETNWQFLLKIAPKPTLFYNIAKLFKRLINRGQIYHRFELVSKWLRSGFVGASCWFRISTNRQRSSHEWATTLVNLRCQNASILKSGRSSSVAWVLTGQPIQVGVAVAAIVLLAVFLDCSGNEPVIFLKPVELLEASFWQKGFTSRYLLSSRIGWPDGL